MIYTNITTILEMIKVTLYDNKLMKGRLAFSGTFVLYFLACTTVS